MKTDKLRQQEKLPPVQRVRELLHAVKIPKKTPTEWSAVERDLFLRLNTSEEPEKQTYADFFKRLLRPAALVPACAAALLLAVLSISLISRKSELPLVRVIDVHGKLLVRPHQKAVCDTIRDNGARDVLSRIAQGAFLATLDSSTFILQIGKSCALELSPNTRLTIMDVSATRMVFNLSRGSLLAKVGKRDKNQRFLVETPTAVCRVTGTIFKVDVLPAIGDSLGQTVLTVYEGNVAFVPPTGPRNQKTVSSGQRCSSIPGGEPYYVSESQTPIKAISTLELLVNAKYSTPEPSGLLDISSQPEETMVLLDDTIVGATPLMLRKPIGGHRIKLSARGYFPWERQFFIGRDSISSLTAELVSAGRQGRDDSCRTPARKIRKRARHTLNADPESLLVAFPDYVEANIQLSIGEYQKALGILDSLKNNYPLDMKNRKSIMSKINNCYAKLGDFTGALAGLQDKLDMTSSSSSAREKEQLLWEITNINANCIGDYEGAELAIIDLLALGMDGHRTCEAYEKLADVQYMLGKSDSAAATFKTLLKKCPGAPAKERILFSLASILNDDMRHCKEAIGIYSKVMNEFPSGNYYKAALFARAECFDRLGRYEEAMSDYGKCLALDPHGIWNSACAQRLSPKSR